MSVAEAARTQAAAARSRQARRSRGSASRYTRRERLLLTAAVLPAFAWLAFAQGYPLVYSLYLSFQKWALDQSDAPQGFAGLGNFTQALADPQFQHGLRLSALFLGSVFIELTIGFALAYFTVGEGRAIRIVRTLLIVPMVIAPIAVGTIWRLLLDTNSGLVNAILSGVGLGRPDWLGGQSTAVLSVVAVDVWEWIPFAMIIYSAALTGIDPGLLESARLDGASAWQVVRRLIVPLTTPATLLIAIFRFIDAFLVVDIAYSLLYGGPGFATTTATLWVYNHGLKYFDIGEAAAASWILLLICVVLAAVLLGVKGRVERWVAGR